MGQSWGGKIDLNFLFYTFLTLLKLFSCSCISFINQQVYPEGKKNPKSEV